MGSMTERVKMNEQGRIVVPAAIRRQLGLKGGDTLIIKVDEEGEELRLSTPMANLRRMQRRLAHLRPDDGRRWSDELIAERRREAEIEKLDSIEEQRRARRA